MTSFTVRCTHCDTAFPVDPEKVPEGGVRARCTNCEGIFFVSVPASLALVDAPTEAPEPEVVEVDAPDDEAVEVDTRDDGAVEVDAPDDDAPELEAPDVDAPDLDTPEPDVRPAEAALGVEIEHPDAVLDDAGFASFDDEVEAVEAAAAESAIVRPLEEDVEDSGEVPDTTADDFSVEFDDAVDLVESEVEVEPEEIPAVPAGFQFGKRDPHDKARRLARVLVSDMVTYNPEAHARALAQGTLADDFEEEISKSWHEYVDQVGRDLAESTPYWTNALNEVLARGEDVF